MPEVAPRWPNATTASALVAFAAAAFTAAVAFVTWNGPKAPGKTSCGASSFVNPISSRSTPLSNSKVLEGRHCFGVLP